MADAHSAEVPRRRRSLTQSLGSIVLGFEGIIVFFAALVAFGLKQLPPEWAFGGGAALILVTFLAAGLMRYPFGVWVGHGVQVLILATGFISPAMFFIGGAFVATWIYCMAVGHRADSAAA